MWIVVVLMEDSASATRRMRSECSKFSGTCISDVEGSTEKRGEPLCISETQSLENGRHIVKGMRGKILNRL